MKVIKKESKEFKRILHNLTLENLTLHPNLQSKVLEIVNSQAKITSSLIKDALKHGKI